MHVRVHMFHDLCMNMRCCILFSFLEHSFFYVPVVMISLMSNIFAKVSISPVVEKNLDHILLLDDITGKEFVKLCRLIDILLQLLFIENVPVLRNSPQINSLFKISMPFYLSLDQKKSKRPLKDDHRAASYIRTSYSLKIMRVGNGRIKKTVCKPYSFFIRTAAAQSDCPKGKINAQNF
jgi:hypothetical protein